MKDGVNSKNSNTKWVLSILLLSFFLSVGMSLLSNGIMQITDNAIVASVVVFAIIFINIISDTIGTAVTAADVVPFNAMASRKIAGAKLAIKMIKNADKVSNIFNDVIGDICGVISGAGAAYIISDLTQPDNLVLSTVMGLCVTGLVASTTVAGKAIGKFLAISKCDSIIFFVARVGAVFARERTPKKIKKEHLRNRR